MHFLLLALLPQLATAEPNRLTLGSGAVVVRAAPAAEKFAAVAIDGSDQTLSIGIPRREPLPLQLVIELPAPTTIERFVLPEFNEFGSAKGRHVKTLRVEGSSTSADDGFAPLLDIVLAEGTQAPQTFAVPQPQKIRWVRLTALDRHTQATADTEPHNFTEIEAYGAQDAVANGENRFTGRWRIRRKGLNDEPGLNTIELFQRGQTVHGCQVLGGQMFELNGSVEAGLARLVATQLDGDSRRPMTAVVTADGQLSGVSFAGPPRAFYAAPDADATTPCSEAPPANPIEDALSSGETAVLYGIHFDVDSDTLRSDARPALDQLLAALNAVPTLAVTIEGHTDSDASEAHNLELSERRAKAVVTWLVDKGVAASRLNAVGKGEAEPIADNGSSSGRALNRRVEVEPAP